MPLQLNDKTLTFALLCLANITISFNFAALAAVVPAMSLELRSPAVSVARILHYYMIPYGLGALMYAPLARRWSYRSLMIASLLVYAESNLVCALTNSLPVMLAARVLMGMAAASIIPLTLIVIGQGFEREVRGRYVGMFFSTSFVASVAGIVVSGMAPWRWLFTIPAVIGVVNSLLVALFASELLKRKEASPVNYWAVLGQPKVQHIFLFIFVISFLYHGVHKWFGVYLDREYHLSQVAISFYYMLIALFGAIGQNVGGWITDKKGRAFACQMGVWILAAATMGLSGHYALPVLGVLFALFSIGWTIGHNGVSTVLTDMPEETRAEIAGLNSAIRFFSGGLGFLIGGPFVEKDFGLTFFGFGVLMLLASMFLKKIIPLQTTASERINHVTA